jgi:hypothetical protein
MKLCGKAVKAALIFIFIPRISLFVLIPKFITHASEHYTEISVQLLKIRKKKIDVVILLLSVVNAQSKYICTCHMQYIKWQYAYTII